MKQQYKSDLVLLIEKLESDYTKCLAENVRLKSRVNKLVQKIKKIKKESKLLKKNTKSTA